MDRRHTPDQCVVDLTVFMRQSMALSHDWPPRNVGMCALKFLGDAPRRFADNLDLSFDGRSQHQICHVLFKRAAGDKRLHPRAALSISRSHAASRARSSRSRGINHPMIAQDRVPPKWIANSTLLHDVHLASEDSLQLVLNLGRAFEGKPVAGIELDHDIDITLIAEIVAQYRAKERELPNTEFSAERLDLRERNWNLRLGHLRLGNSNGFLFPFLPSKNPVPLLSSSGGRIYG